MDNKKIIDELTSLLQLDHDAASAYDAAIDKFGEGDIKEHLKQFRDDHNRHVIELSNTIDSLGVKAPVPELVITDAIANGILSLQNEKNKQAVLDTLYMVEQITNKSYGDAMNQQFPEQLKNLLQRNLSDEQRHREFISSELPVTQAPAF